MPSFHLLINEYIFLKLSPSFYHNYNMGRRNNHSIFMSYQESNK